LDGNVYEEESARTDVIVDVGDCAFDVAHLDLLIGMSLVLQPNSLGSNPSLTRRQIVGSLWGLRQDEGRNEGGYDGDKTLEKEYVAPGMYSRSGDAPFWDLYEPGSKKTTKGAGNRGSGHVYTDSK
jgi:hypothetical protein